MLALSRLLLRLLGLFVGHGWHGQCRLYRRRLGFRRPIGQQKLAQLLRRQLLAAATVEQLPQPLDLATLTFDFRRQLSDQRKHADRIARSDQLDQSLTKLFHFVRRVALHVGAVPRSIVIASTPSSSVSIQCEGRGSACAA